MKKLVAVTAIASGLLLLLVPRYILPACEYLGHPKMHCSDTAHAEYVVGILLIVLGGATAYLRSRKADLICAAGSSFSRVVAFLLPDKFVLHVPRCRAVRHGAWHQVRCRYIGNHYVDRSSVL
jgi:hypothetical protein